MARTTLKTLSAENEALRAEIGTLRTLLEQARANVAERDERINKAIEVFRAQREQIAALERRTAQPARGRIVARREPSALEVAYREYVAAQRDLAVAERRSVAVDCFAVWSAKQQEAA